MLRIRRWLIPFLFLLLASPAWVTPASAQAPNKRLILKDGSYQTVVQYTVAGDRVRYYSAERADWEELPSDLVDWVATDKWAKEHAPGSAPAASSNASPGNSEAVELDKEEQQDRAQQNPDTPEVAPKLYLLDQGGVWALDNYQGRPELAPLAQNDVTMNQEQGHNLFRAKLNALGGAKQAIEIPGVTSKIRLHVAAPAIYVSLPPDNGVSTGPETLTGAAPGKNEDASSSPTGQYAIVRVKSDPRHGDRIVSAVKIGTTGNVSQTEDVIPTTSQILPGNRWIKLTLRQPLSPGDYALMKLLGPGEINAAVWDFSIDPQAPDNQDTLLPLNSSPR